ncbi:hypothetical protein [Desulfonatronum parangueonense]
MLIEISRNEKGASHRPFQERKTCCGSILFEYQLRMISRGADELNESRLVARGLSEGYATTQLDKGRLSRLAAGMTWIPPFAGMALITMPSPSQSYPRRRVSDR